MSPRNIQMENTDGLCNYVEHFFFFLLYLERINLSYLLLLAREEDFNVHLKERVMEQLLPRLEIFRIVFFFL